jgi:hypothetical protein
LPKVAIPSEFQRRFQNWIDSYREHVVLGRTTDGLVEWRSGLRRVGLNATDDSPQLVRASGLQACLLLLRDLFLSINASGVYVAPDPLDITETGKDLRNAGTTKLRINLSASSVDILRIQAAMSAAETSSHLRASSTDRNQTVHD